MHVMWETCELVWLHSSQWFPLPPSSWVAVICKTWWIWNSKSLLTCRIHRDLTYLQNNKISHPDSRLDGYQSGEEASTCGGVWVQDLSSAWHVYKKVSMGHFRAWTWCNPSHPPRSLQHINDVRIHMYIAQNLRPYLPRKKPKYLKSLK